MSRRLQADLLLMLNTFVWGATFVLVKDALVENSVFVYLALRFLLAVAILLLMYGRDLRNLPVGAYRAGLLIGCFMFTGYAFQTIGIHLTTPSKAAFITGFAVVLVPIFLGVFGKTRIHAAVWAGASAALAGLYCVTVPNAGVGGLNSGDLLVLCCTVMYALHIIAVGHYSPRYPAGVLALLQVGVTAIFTSAAIPLASVAHIERPRITWNSTLIAAVLITGIFATALAFAAQVWAQQHTSSSHVAIIFSLEPVFAAITSYVFYGERMTGRVLLGAGLILAGIFIAELRGPAPTSAESSAPPEPGVG